MWSPKQLALFALGVSAGSDNTECGAFTNYSAPGTEVCADDTCYKIKIECPDGYTSSYDGSLKCKGGIWKGTDDHITCNVDYKLCDYDKLASTSDTVKTRCDGNTCKFSCKDGSEISVDKATCNTQFGIWEYAGLDGKPGKIRCAKPPKAPKPTKPPKAADCAKFDNFDAESVDIVECTDKRCTFACKEGFHTITADTAKCRSAGYWKIADGQETVRCFAHDNVWINEWKENEVDIEPPFKCDPKLIRRVTLANCTDLENGAITNCDVVCRGVKIDEVRCINHRPVWSNEYFEC